jgi:hypothetical protein
MQGLSIPRKAAPAGSDDILQGALANLRARVSGTAAASIAHLPPAPPSPAPAAFTAAPPAAALDPVAAAAAAAAVAARGGAVGASAAAVAALLQQSASPPPLALPAGGVRALCRPGGLALQAPHLTVLPSGVTVAPVGGLGGMAVSLAGGPAASAALLGPGGLPSMLAAFTPTRVLVVLNALTDAELGARGTLRDVVADLAAEAQGAVRAAAAGEGGGGEPLGGLVRAVAPRPRRGEALEPRVARSKAPLKHVGADGMLEDGPRGPARAAPGALPEGLPSEALTLLAGDGGLAPGLGQASRKQVSTVAAEFFKKQLGGGFSDHVALGAGEGRGGGFASLPEAPQAPPSPAAAAAGGHDSATQEDDPARARAGGEAVPAGAPRTRGLGRVYLEFGCAGGAVAALLALSGRFFNGRILVTSFEQEAAFCGGAVVNLTAEPCVPPGMAGCPPEHWEEGALVMQGLPVEGGGAAIAAAPPPPPPPPPPPQQQQQQAQATPDEAPPPGAAAAEAAAATAPLIGDVD